MSDEFTDMEELIDAGEENFVLVDQAVDDPAFPFWRVAKADISGLLKILKEIAMRNTDQISRSVLLEPGDNPGDIKFTVTNKDVYFSGRIPIKNTENVLQESVIFSVQQLNSIISFSHDLVIYKNDTQVVAAFMRGDQPLEVFGFSKALYEIPNYHTQPKIQKSAVSIDSIELKQQMDLS